jgi:hypothetical protein
MTKTAFIRLDGDNIGDAIELALLNENYVQAQQIHDIIQSGINHLSNLIQLRESAKILLIGSDDILFSAQNTNDLSDFVERLRIEFKKLTKFSISIGIGDTITYSLLNLKKAKLSGRDQTISE